MNASARAMGLARFRLSLLRAVRGPDKTATASYWSGTILILAGVVLLLGTGALQAYGLYERFQFEQRPLPVEDVADPGAAQLDSSVNVPMIRLQPAAELEGAAELAAEDRWQVVPLRPEPPLKFAAPTRMRIPRIEVDSAVVHAKVVGDTWEVPKFVVGHLDGTALPGQLGNSAYSGHLESISSGNVFARLEEVKVGDEVVIFAGSEPRKYRVAETKVVRNNDLSVVAPTATERVTLLTCTGTWNPITRDYSHRRIVVATPVDDPPPPWATPGN